MRLSPEIPPLDQLQSSSPQPRAGRQCVGAACETLVINGRICDACIDGAAIELARGFETQLIADGHEPGSAELRAALAGGAGVLPVSWFQKHGGFDFDLSLREAELLRAKADAACLLVALGGVRSLQHLPGASGVRAAVDAWANESVDISAAAQSPRSPRSRYGRTGVIDRMEASEGVAAAGELFGRLPGRIDAGLVDLSKPEHRFDAYMLAVMAIALYLLAHLPIR